MIGCKQNANGIFPFYRHIFRNLLRYISQLIFEERQIHNRLVHIFQLHHLNNLQVHKITASLGLYPLTFPYVTRNVLLASGKIHR